MMELFSRRSEPVLKSKRIHCLQIEKCLDHTMTIFFLWNNSLGNRKLTFETELGREFVRLWLMTRSPVWCLHLLELEGIWLLEIIKIWLLIYIYIWLLHILYNNIFGIWLRKIIKSRLLMYMYTWLLHTLYNNIFGIWLYKIIKSWLLGRIGIYVCVCVFVLNV